MKEKYRSPSEYKQAFLPVRYPAIEVQFESLAVREKKEK